MFQQKVLSMQTLSWFIVAAFLIGSLIVLLGVFIIGGVELFRFLQVALLQAFGLGLAATSSLFFFVRLVWGLNAPPMGISMVFFVIGAALFVSVSVGRLYMFQYPMYVQSFGPGGGPGLPLLNVLSFFQDIEQFERVADIARDPLDVSQPLTLLDCTVLSV